MDPQYEAAGRGTVFDEPASLQSDAHGPEFDPGLLVSVLGGARALASRPAGLRRPGSCPGGVRVLDGIRAQNMAIVLNRLPVTPEELCSRLREGGDLVDSPSSDLCAEDVELLLGQLPTAREVQELLVHADRPEELRDVERKVLPFCTLPNAQTRLRLLHIGLTHAEQYTNVLIRLEQTQTAASEVLGSRSLHHLLRMVLKTANYINHGADQGAVALTVRSLEAFASFRVGSASALHYLCLSFCDAAFLQRLNSELGHLRPAARDCTHSQEHDVRAFGHLAALVERELEGQGAGATASSSTDAVSPSAANAGATAELLAALRAEHGALQQAAGQARARAEEAQRFLGETGQRPLPSEEFFANIVHFLDLLSQASAEISRDPARWKRRARSSSPGSVAAAAGA